MYTGFYKLSGEGYTTLKFAAIARTVLMFSLFLGDCVCKDKRNNCTSKRKNASSKIWECSNELIVDNVEYGRNLGFKTIKNGKISPDMHWISKWVETFIYYILLNWDKKNFCLVKVK